MSIQDIVKETEIRLKRIYSLRMRKYLATIYLSIGLYFPVVFVITKLYSDTWVLNLLQDVLFLSIIFFCIYVEFKLSYASAILKRLNNVVNDEKPKYSFFINLGKLSFDVISIVFLPVTVIAVLYSVTYLQYILPFIYLEYYLSHLYLYDKVQLKFEDWIAIITAISLPFIPLNQLLSIFFGASWIISGIISLVRVYG
ncbi:hypothetical protein HS7_01330 [Sulfolobales archaeon HS-7]|nr:hypothetical protein HS7_01330 [Sulfolobales archaeon HS-7]